MKSPIYLTRTHAVNLGDVVLQKNVRERILKDGYPVTTVGFRDDVWKTYSNEDIIISAGGFCCHHHQRPGEFQIYDWLLQRGNRLYFWGPGYNEYAVDVYNPDYTTPYDTEYDGLFRHENVVLRGFRDYGNPHEYVPCPSCIDPLFDEKFDLQHETVILEHESLPLCLPDGGEIPRKRNTLEIYSFEEIIQFIGGADSVITNTYHGAYWSMLLNKKVIVYKPWASKFHTFKYTPSFANEQDYRQKIVSSRNATPDYLQECRRINEDFYSKLTSHLLATG